MTLEPILIDGGWESADSPVGSFQSVNPALKASLPQAYPISSLERCGTSPGGSARGG